MTELQQRKLFEYFIVVALHKTKAGVPYLPEVTQQFPLKVKCKTCKKKKKNVVKYKDIQSVLIFK